MPVGALIGTAVVGAGASVISGNKAANATTAAANQADTTNRYIYDQSRADQAPYRAVGNNALYKLADMYGVQRPTDTATNDNTFTYNGQTITIPNTDTSGTGQTAGYSGFEASPGYQFRLQEGMKAIQRSASARGALASGATMKSLNNYAQGQASSGYENYANRLASLAGIGQTATNATTAAGQSYANQQTNTNLAAGQARASAYANTGSAINQGVGNLASAYLYNKGYGGVNAGAGMTGATPPINGGVFGNDASYNYYGG